MSWLDKLERRFGKFAIKGLMSYIIVLNVVVYILMLADTSNAFIGRLVLDPALVMNGEVWRLITYIFIPPTTSPFWIIFALYLYYIIGRALEQEWGSFRFNVYYFVGMLATTAAAFLFGISATPLYLNLSLFLAFAAIFPNYEFLLFFVLPMKVKYLAWFNWAYLGITVLFFPIWMKVAAAASVVNFFIFFGKDITTNTKTRRQVYHNRKRFLSDLPRDFTIHKCMVCGKTEKDDSKLEFRYCSTCEGDYEYCMEHLKAHEHIKKEEGNEN